MRFCCRFKTSKKVGGENVEQATNTCHHQMHTDWPSAIGQEVSLEVRYEVAHVYFAQHCFFLTLPHVPVGIQNAVATS